MKYQILADSACDVKDDYVQGDLVRFKTIPLVINVGDKEFVDDAQLDPDAMLHCLRESKEKSCSACPSPDAFMQEFDKAEETFIITITSKLSGCYNSACTAQKTYEGKGKVHVIDSKATCGTEVLIIDKLLELMSQNLSFEEIVTQIEKFRDEKTLLFILQRFDNLVNNGRMSKVAGMIASTLVIRPICKAEDGEIKIAKKTIGAKNAFNKLVKMIGEFTNDFTGKKIVISQCQAEEEALQLKEDILALYPFQQVQILKMRGLASYYALEKGVIVCF